MRWYVALSDLRMTGRTYHHQISGMVVIWIVVDVMYLEMIDIAGGTEWTY